MATKVNIPTTVVDHSYRYKMQALVAKKEGAGNGKKTRIVNMEAIATSLKCPPAYPLKWFGAEVGVQCKFEPNAAIINGHHDTEDLVPILDKFIETYILCPTCFLPELKMRVKGKRIKGKCNACGHDGELDGFHRLAAYIINNPPNANMGDVTLGGKMDKAQRRAMKADKQRSQACGDDDSGSEDGEVKKKSKKEKKEKKEKNEKKSKKSKDKERVDSDDASSEGKKEKKSKKKSKEKEDVSDSHSEDKSTNDPDEDKNEWEREEITEVIRRMTGFIEESDPLVKEDYFEELRLLQISNGFNNRMRLYICVESLFPDGTMTAKTMKPNLDLIKNVIDNGHMSGGEILWAFEIYLGVHTNLGKAYALIMKALYEEDVVEEEELIAHYGEDCKELDHPGFQEALAFTTPLIEWLQQSDDESSDEE